MATFRTVDRAFRSIGPSLSWHASQCGAIAPALERVRSSRTTSTSTTVTPPKHTLTCSHIFTQQHVDAFCQLTDDPNPIHQGSHAPAIVPGILSASLFPSLISHHFPGSIYASQTLTFRQPISVDEPVEVSLTSHGARHGLMRFQCAIRKKEQEKGRGNAVDGTAIVKLKTYT